MFTKKRRKNNELSVISKISKNKSELRELQDEEGDNLLHLAVVAAFDSQIMINICHFVSENFGLKGINCYNNLHQTPLHIASCIGNEYVVQILLDFGADISCVDRNSENCIHLAVKYGNKKCLEILLSNCKNNKQLLNALNIDGFAPLHLVIESEANCSLEMLTLLVKSGADINVRDGLSGRTPLIHSLINSRKPNNCIKNLLLSLNADISLSDYSGFKPIDVMEENDI